ncbi:hypothetical protein [Niallia sp. 03091]|uniref:hypothetical protein n=1 Tax=Niallia sp. 03091 TaxID=3458059 RepID=UPI0040440B87
MNKCFCNQCGKTFVIKTQTTKHPKQIIETFFHCSHCNHKYLVTVTNAEVRIRIQHFATEWAKMSKLKNGKEWKKSVWMKKYNKLQKYKSFTDEMIERLKKGLENGSLQKM